MTIEDNLHLHEHDEFADRRTILLTRFVHLSAIQFVSGWVVFVERNDSVSGQSEIKINFKRTKLT